MENDMRDSEHDAVHEQLQALGYVDPGAGSSFMQLALAAVFKISSRVKRIFKRTPKSSLEE